jgi:hypothetical protein
MNWGSPRDHENGAAGELVLIARPFFSEQCGEDRRFGFGFGFARPRKDESQSGGKAPQSKSVECGAGQVSRWS